MLNQRIGRQADLFPPQPDLFDAVPAPAAMEPVPADFVEDVRRELVATLERARGAASLPWPDLTRTTLAELRFQSMSRWLPVEEAERLRAEFGREMARLYVEAGEIPREGAGGGS